MHAYICIQRHTHTHLDALFQSKVFWRKVTGEPEVVHGDERAVDAGVFCARQGVVSTQHRPSATSVGWKDATVRDAAMS